MTTKFKVLIFGSIGAGNYGEDDWTPETDVIIKKVMANEREGNPLNAAQLFLSIADVPYTKTYVPMSVIGNTPEYCWKPELRVSKGARIYAKVYNAGSSAITPELIIEYEEA